MKLVADLHTHTIASGHAFSTIQEMAQAAAQKGLKYLGFTEHGPTLPGGPHIYFFYNMRIVPTEMYGVQILRGVEANIIDKEGNLDLPAEILDHLDLIWAGFHLYQSPPWSREENTQALIKALRNPYVDGIVHPGNPEFPIDAQAVVQIVKETGKVLEINNSSALSRQGSQTNCLRIARLAKEMEALVMVNSDAHISYDIGRCDRVLSLVQEAGLGEKDILNASVERIQEFLTRRKKEREKLIIPKI